MAFRVMTFVDVIRSILAWTILLCSTLEEMLFQEKG